MTFDIQAAYSSDDLSGEKSFHGVQHTWCSAAESKHSDF